MGGYVSKVVAKVTGPIRNYNVRERAHKLLDSEKPRPAPRYPTEEKLRQVYSNLTTEEFSRKDENLVVNLKSVFVTSDETNKSDRGNEQKPLPSFRGAVDIGNLSFLEPAHVPEGKITLQNAVTMITDYTADSQFNSVKKLSKTYKLSESDVESIVKHFGAFQLYSPEKGDSASSKIVEWFIPPWIKDKLQKQIGSK